MNLTKCANVVRQRQPRAFDLRYGGDCPTCKGKRCTIFYGVGGIERTVKNDGVVDKNSIAGFYHCFACYRPFAGTMLLSRYNVSPRCPLRNS
jgi:hypothetical protein